MSNDLAGRAAIVTGGASGIGAALVTRLTEGGAQVLAVDANAEGLDRISAATGCATRVADTSDEQANRAMVAEARDLFGRLDLVFLNAGILGRPIEVLGQPYGPADLDMDRYRAVRAVNLDGVVFGTVAAAAVMAEHGGGSIVATASTAGLTAWTMTPMYAATKHGVVGWVRAVGPAFAEQRVRVNAICPAGVATPLVGRSADQADERTLDPAVVADAAIATALSNATGQAVTVVAGRDPVMQTHEFSDVPGFP